MRSFILTTLLLALTCAPSRGQFNLPSSAAGNNRFPRYPAQTNSFGSSNPNSIDAGFAGSRYPVTQSLSSGSPGAGLGNAGLGASPASSQAGNPNARIFGLFGGGGRGGGLFSNLLGALTGGNRGPIGGGGGGGGGGAYPYPVPAPFPAYQPYGIPPPYAGGFGYPGFGGGFGNGYFG
ncbi:PREDICTED: keratin, type II cytoskeletal 1-like [Rhagoletis zephyria]|uniref:keratin, type II cytoskeletal 1-like n=1 Tax=Rhagoletis zephyria TaxID=28612 RepID=UPI000811235B|nr:PREDICTED: keratin, type II cytoskeletal 1-like [Rhagoletis zephyria]